MTHSTRINSLPDELSSQPAELDTNYFAPIQLTSSKGAMVIEGALGSLAGGLIFSFALTVYLMVGF